MLTGAVLALVFVPVFFVVVRSVFKSGTRHSHRDGDDAGQRGL